MCQSGKSRFELLGLGGAESLRTRLKEEEWVLEHVPDEGVDDLRFQKQVRPLKVIHVGMAREASDMRDFEELMRTIAQALHPIHRVRAMSHCPRFQASLEPLEGAYRKPGRGLPPTIKPSDSRRYLERENHFSATRKGKVLEFCDALERRMEDVDDKTVPLPRPLQNFGYSKDAGERIQNHLTHKSSNYIMGLTEACVIYFYETKSMRTLYRLDAFPICVRLGPARLGGAGGDYIFMHR